MPAWRPPSCELSFVSVIVSLVRSQPILTISRSFSVMLPLAGDRAVALITATLWHLEDYGMASISDLTIVEIDDSVHLGIRRTFANDNKGNV